MENSVSKILVTLVFLCLFIVPHICFAEETTLTPYTFKFDGNPHGYIATWKHVRQQDDKNVRGFILKDSKDLDWTIGFPVLTEIEGKPYNSRTDDTLDNDRFMIQPYDHWPGIDNAWSLSGLRTTDKPFTLTNCKISFNIYPISKHAKPIKSLDEIVDWKTYKDLQKSNTKIVWVTPVAHKQHWSQEREVKLPGDDYNKTLIPFKCDIKAHDSDWEGFPPTVEIQMSLDWKIRQYYMIYDVLHEENWHEYMGTEDSYDIMDWSGRITLKNLNIKSDHSLIINLVRKPNVDIHGLRKNELKGRIADYHRSALCVRMKLIGNPNKKEE